MPGELMPRRTGNLPVSRQVMRDLIGIRDEVNTTQAEVRGVSAVAEHAFSEIAYLTRVRSELELANPAASEALTLIANITNAHIARTVSRFGSGW